MDTTIFVGLDVHKKTRQVVKQPRQEFPSAIPTKGKGDAALPAHAKFAEVRRPARLHSQPLQSGTHAHQPPEFRSADLRFKDRRTAALTAWRQLFAA